MDGVQIRQVRWIDPRQGRDETCDLLITAAGAQAVEQLHADADTLDGQGLWLLPGLVDLGHELLESNVAENRNMATELRAARACGLSLVCANPHTRPLLDSAAAVQWIEHHARGADTAQLRLLGALTQDLAGHQLSNMGALRDAGCVGLSQGRAALPEPDLLRQCLRYAADLDMTVHLAPRAPALNQGCVHEGEVATALGLESIPAAAETTATAMLLALAEDTGCALHFCRLSSGRAAQMVADARQRGLEVTADVAIWNLLYDHSAVGSYDSRFHLQPPLRDAADREQLLELLRQGQIDAICSNHRPLGRDAKFGPFSETEPGANGLDGYLALLLRLLDEDFLSPLELAERTSLGPLSILGDDPEELPQRWLLIDPRHGWRLDDDNRLSAGQHSPLQDRELRGAVAGWIDQGQLSLQGSWKRRLGV